MLQCPSPRDEGRYNHRYDVLTDLDHPTINPASATGSKKTERYVETDSEKLNSQKLVYTVALSVTPS